MPTEATSDLLYVRGEDRNQLVTPVIEVNLGNWTDHSGTIEEANAPVTLFEQGGVETVSRFVINIGQSGVLWVNFFGGDAGPNEPGSVPVKPFTKLDIPTRGPVSICGDTAGIPYTAGAA